MARSQARSLRKASGGRYHSMRTKRKYELARYPAQTKVDPVVKMKKKRTLGGNRKNAVLTTNLINVTDKKGKATKTEILTVVENPANPNLVRRNILTKGAVVDTKMGKVRVTNRPGQEGSVSGVLL